MGYWGLNLDWPHLRQAPLVLSYRKILSLTPVVLSESSQWLGRVAEAVWIQPWRQEVNELPTQIYSSSSSALFQVLQAKTGGLHSGYPTPQDKTLAETQQTSNAGSSCSCIDHLNFDKSCHRAWIKIFWPQRKLLRWEIKSNLEGIQACREEIKELKWRTKGRSCIFKRNTEHKIPFWN